MIEITEVEKTYFRCQSCYATKETSESNLYQISIGLKENEVSSIRLCIVCLDQLKNEISKRV